MAESSPAQTAEKHSIIYHAAADYAASKHLDWERLSYNAVTASEHWRRRYWRLWFRSRWIEHVLGEKRWIEMDDERFGLLKRSRRHNPVLVERVVDRLLYSAGLENLDLIFWATDWNIDEDEVIDILKTININDIRVNGKRIEHFWGRLIA